VKLEHPARLLAGCLALILLGLFNFYVIRRALKTGSIRSKLVAYDRSRDPFSFYATLCIHIACAAGSVVASAFFLWRFSQL
jgi:hypothetical protein